MHTYANNSGCTAVKGKTHVFVLLWGGSVSEQHTGGSLSCLGLVGFERLVAKEMAPFDSPQVYTRIAPAISGFQKKGYSTYVTTWLHYP